MSGCLQVVLCAAAGLILWELPAAGVAVSYLGPARTLESSCYGVFGLFVCFFLFLEKSKPRFAIQICCVELTGSVWKQPLILG